MVKSRFNILKIPLVNRMVEISLVTIHRRLPTVISRNNFEVCKLKPHTQPTGTRKKVDYSDGTFASTTNSQWGTRFLGYFLHVAHLPLVQTLERQVKDPPLIYRWA